jgi:hypothetical protein
MMYRLVSVIAVGFALAACSGGLGEGEVREIVDEAVQTAVAARASASEIELPPVISVREIELRDDSGTLRGRLGVNLVGNSELALFDAQSDLFPRWTASVGEDGDTLLTFWRTSDKQVGIGLQITESGVGLIDTNGVIRLSLALSAQPAAAPLLGFRDAAGAVRVGVTDVGLSVRDAEGALLFTAPEKR